MLSELPNLTGLDVYRPDLLRARLCQGLRRPEAIKSRMKQKFDSRDDGYCKGAPRNCQLVVQHIRQQTGHSFGMRKVW